MNKKSYKIFMDKVLNFNIEFINLSIDDKVKYNDYLHKVTSLAYNYPLFV